MHLLHQGSSQYRPGGELGPACWPHHDLLVVLRGSLLFTQPEAKLARAGDAMIMPPQTPFHAQAGELGGHVWVHHFRVGPAPSERWLRSLAAGCLHHYPGAAHSPWSQALLARISVVHESQEERAQSRLLLRLLLDQIRREPPFPIDSPIKRALAWAEERDWKGITLARLATEAGLSTSHFRARFKVETGRSVGDHLKAERRERARQWLRASDKSIKMISDELGYSEVSAFHHAFKADNGLTPSQYRRRYPQVV